MDHLKTIYRDFDIRGKYGEEITDEEVNKIGQAIVKKFGLKKVAIGRDIRPSADALFNALASGICAAGGEVIDLGLCTTPMTYYICGTTDVDATVMITASHMPSEYNGLKISVEDAKPVVANVLQEIKEIVGQHTYSSTGTTEGITTHALQKDWIQKFKSAHNLAGSGLSIVIDPANMIGILEIDTFRAFEPDITVHTIYDTYDASCPNHEANPIKAETLVDLGKEVVKQHAHLGIAFDGDADRVGFVDEQGTPVSSDIIGIFLARYILERYPDATIVCDIRCSKALDDEIKKLGGKVVRERVGHTHIRSRMRKENAMLGIEISGHFFFKDTFFSEGGPLPAFIVLEMLKEEQKPLSELVTEATKYFHSGEINSEVTRTPAAIYEELAKAFSDVEKSDQDGLSLYAKDWWCNVRPSANDPVMRLNLEAHTKEKMEEMRDAVLSIIRK